jgi:hypothetical protein
MSYEFSMTLQIENNQHLIIWDQYPYQLVEHGTTSLFVSVVYQVLYTNHLKLPSHHGFMGTWSCCIDYGFSVQTRGFSLLCIYRLDHLKGHTIIKFQIWLLVFVKFIYRSNLLQSSSINIDTLGAFGHEGWFCFSRESETLESAPNVFCQFVSEEKWLEPFCNFSYANEMAGTQFRSSRFVPSPSSALNSCFFQFIILKCKK